MTKDYIKGFEDAMKIVDNFGDCIELTSDRVWEALWDELDQKKRDEGIGWN